MKLNHEVIEITEDNYEKLASKYKPLIVSCIKYVRWKYQYNFMLEIEDMESEAKIALVKAIRLYDFEKCNYFGTYLKIVVLNELKQFARMQIPHKMVRDGDKFYDSGKPKFRWEKIEVTSTEIGLTGLLKEE